MRLVRRFFLLFRNWLLLPMLVRIFCSLSLFVWFSIFWRFSLFTFSPFISHFFDKCSKFSTYMFFILCFFRLVRSLQQHAYISYMCINKNNANRFVCTIHIIIIIPLTVPFHKKSSKPKMCLRIKSFAKRMYEKSRLHWIANENNFVSCSVFVWIRFLSFFLYVAVFRSSRCLIRDCAAHNAHDVCKIWLWPPMQRKAISHNSFSLTHLDCSYIVYIQ